MTNPRKIKELSSLAQRCFEKIVGEPPNYQLQVFYTPEEIEYTFDVLSTMVRGYLKEITQTEFDVRKKQADERAAERKAAEEREKEKTRFIMEQRLQERYAKQEIDLEMEDPLEQATRSTDGLVPLPSGETMKRVDETLDEIVDEAVKESEEDPNE
jgi:hypothetical protein